MLEKRSATYIVILKSHQHTEINVGKSLSLLLQQGYYLYIGSAFGPGGVASRIKHHTSKVTRPHWHLDYLRLYTEVIEVWFSYDEIKRECQWASIMNSIGEDYSPIKGFGATDCTCPTHLMYSSMKPDYMQFKYMVMNNITSHQDIDFLTMESGEDGHR